MFDRLAPVAEHLNTHRKAYTAAAVATTTAVAVTRRALQWKEFFTNPEQFDKKYHAVQ